MPKKKKSPKGPRKTSASSWSRVEPRSTKERAELMAKCAETCFLRPHDLGFPICPRCNDPYCQRCLNHDPSLKGRCCEVDCQGLLAAKRRAAQYGYQGIVKKANRLAKSRGWITKREKRDRQRRKDDMIITCPNN